MTVPIAQLFNERALAIIGAVDRLAIRSHILPNPGLGELLGFAVGHHAGGPSGSLRYTFGACRASGDLNRDTREPTNVTCRSFGQVFIAHKRRITAFLLIGATSACAPGYTVRTISESASVITLEYTHTMNGELQAAIKTAESRCQQYGRHARLQGQPVPVTRVRSIANFDCIP